jgi:hypothetical protein
LKNICACPVKCYLWWPSSGGFNRVKIMGALMAPPDKKVKIYPVKSKSSVFAYYPNGVYFKRLLF